MGSIRKILLIQIFCFVLLLFASVSFAGMGGGHHMSNYGGNVSDKSNTDIPKNYHNNQHLNHNPSMQEKPGMYNTNDYYKKKGMMRNNFQERNSGNTNNDDRIDNDLNYQHHFNRTDMN